MGSHWLLFTIFHSFMTSTLEIGGSGNGIILTDPATGSRYQISILNGNLNITPVI